MAAQVPAPASALRAATRLLVASSAVSPRVAEFSISSRPTTSASRALMAFDDLRLLALEVLGVPGSALVAPAVDGVAVVVAVAERRAATVADVVVVGVTERGEVVEHVERGDLEVGVAGLVDQRLVGSGRPGVLERRRGARVVGADHGGQRLEAVGGRAGRTTLREDHVRSERRLGADPDGVGGRDVRRRQVAVEQAARRTRVARGGVAGQQEVGRRAVVQDDRAGQVVGLGRAGTGRSRALDLGALDERLGALARPTSPKLFVENVLLIVKSPVGR